METPLKTITVVISQDRILNGVLKPQVLKRSDYLVSEEFIRQKAAEIVQRSLQESIDKILLLRFLPSKPIFVNIFLQDELNLELVHVRFNRDRITIEEVHFTYEVGKTEYILIDRTDYDLDIQRKRKKEKYFEKTDLYFLLNPISNQSKQGNKAKGPIIYTRMHN
jgi:hypothetical protein